MIGGLMSPDQAERYATKPQAFDRPTFIPELPRKPMVFDTIDALARHLHDERGGFALQFGKVGFASYAGSPTFPCFRLLLQDPDSQAETYLGTVAIQSTEADKLQDALRRTEQRMAA